MINIKWRRLDSWGNIGDFLIDELKSVILFCFFGLVYDQNKIRCRRRLRRRSRFRFCFLFWFI